MQVQRAEHDPLQDTDVSMTGLQSGPVEGALRQRSNKADDLQPTP